MNEIITAARHMARGAGTILTEAQSGPLQVSFKGAVDLVTQADRQSEAFVKKAIAEQFPDHEVLAEESGHNGKSADWRWVIDPLDGTVNYAHHLPHFCVLIAVQKRQPAGHYQTMVGITLDPLRQEEFVAVRGQGATLGGEPIKVSTCQQLIHSVVATGFNYDRLFNLKDNHAEFCRLNLITQGARRFGSAGLDLAYVACGRLDMYWEYNLKPWDMLAGALLVTEAGGQISDLTGAPLPPESGTLLASNGLLHAPSVAALASVAGVPINSRQGLAALVPPELADKLA